MSRVVRFVTKLFRHKMFDSMLTPAPGVPMCRLVRPLLVLGLGLCATSGCATVGQGGGPSVAGRTSSKRTVEQKIDKPARASEAAAGISFRAPQRPAVPRTAASESPFDARSSRNSGSRIVQAGHRGGQNKLAQRLIAADAWCADSNPAPGASELVEAHYRSDDDGSNSPVQLQGLLVSESAQIDDGARQEAAAEKMTLHEPVLHEPVLQEPTLHEPMLHEPTLHEPTLHEPVLHEPVLREPAPHGSVSLEAAPHESALETPAPGEPVPYEPAPWDDRPQASGAMRPDVGFVDPANLIQTASAHTEGASPGPWQSELDRLIVRAERELSAMSPGTDPTALAEYRRRQVHLRLLYLVARRPEQALTAIPQLDTADQEYWQQIVWAITNSLDAEDRLSPGERAAQTIQPVNTALRRLREQADLTIRNAAFCEEISYFGNYKRFPREEFVPGQPVLLYAEIENFRSDPSASGEYRTLLKSRIEIFNASGQIQWSKNFAATEDLCRNPRRDYFHNYQFTIPERLPLGPHTLKLTVIDELSGKQSTSAIKFMVK